MGKIWILTPFRLRNHRSFGSPIYLDAIRRLKSLSVITMVAIDGQKGSGEFQKKQIVIEGTKG